MRAAGPSLKTHFGQECLTLATCFRLTLNNELPDIFGTLTRVDATTIDVALESPARGIVVGHSIQFAGLEGDLEVTAMNDAYYEVSAVTSETAFTIIGTPDILGFTHTADTGTVALTYGITNIDRDFLYDGVWYRGSSGYVPSAFRTSGDMSINTTQIQSAYTDAYTVTEQQILTGQLDFAKFLCFIVNYEDLTMGKMIMPNGAGYLGEMTLERDFYVSEFNSLSSLINYDTLNVIQPDCPWDLGDARCTKDVSGVAFTKTDATTVVTDNGNFESGLTDADDFYYHGIIEFTTGGNDGIKREIKRYALANGEITTYEKFPFTVQVGDAFKVTVGCDKSFATCKDKFDNVLWFGGMPHVPGATEIVDVAARRSKGV